MALSIKTNRMLWGRAASRCSLPECRRELVLDPPLDADDPSLVGEAAHIVAEQTDGPRGHSDLPPEQRNKYANLILLCNVHHKQVDDQVSYFTVERLASIKAEHESWVRTSLSDSYRVGHFKAQRFFLAYEPKDFVGRERYLDRLEGEPGVFLLHGEPGCGKSTLALKFAWRVQGAFDAVFFQPCGQRTAEEIAVELAGRLKLDDVRSAQPGVQLEAAQTWLRERLSLLVLDDVWYDDAQKLLPGPPVSVLVTSRRRNWPWVETCSRELVESFSPQEAEMCFRRYLGEIVVAQHRTALLQFAERVERLPLAIAVGAAMLRDSVDPVEDAALGLRLGELRSVADVMEKAVQTQPERERRLLQAMAVCAPEGFWGPLAARIAGLDDHEMSDASNRLFNSSLVRVLDRGRGRFQLHALLREHVRRSAPLPELQERYAAALEGLFEDWEKRWLDCKECLEDVIPTLEHLWQVGNKRRMERLCDWSSNLAWRIGQLDAGLRIEIRRERFWSGPDDAEAKQGLERSFGNQALILRSWGRLGDALALHKREEALCLELGDDEGLQYSYGNQALVLKAQGRLEEAMTLLKSQEGLCLKLGDDDGLQLSYGNQALILKDWGRLGEAMTLHKKEEALCLDLDDKDGLQRSYGNQAPILLAWGRLDKAMELHHKEEKLCLELGARSPLGYCYWNWGLLARAQGDRTVERDKLQAALDIFTELKMPIERDEVAAELAKSAPA
jgi:tetratricopeptide (TPR) repeat protein